MLRGQLNGIEDARRNLKSLNPKPPKKYGRLKITNGADITLRDYEWIWPQMLAKGELHILSGEGGVGKTQIMLNLAATIATGGYFPNMNEPCEVGRVLYISGEDDPEKTLMPRFVACGGDPKNIDLMDSQLIGGERFVLSEVLDELAEWVYDHDIKLIVADPITVLLPDKFDNNSVTDVRRQLHPVMTWANKMDVAMVGLSHLTKNAQSKIAHRTLGSGAWVHAPRIAWAAAEHDGELIFGKFKQNITKGKGVYKFQIEERLVDGMKEPRACIKWLEDSYIADQSINELLDMPVTARGDHGNRAIEMIQDKLRNGTYAKKQEVIAYVQGEVDISERQIERMAKELNVQTKRLNDAHGSHLWSLPAPT